MEGRGCDRDSRNAQGDRWPWRRQGRRARGAQLARRVVAPTADGAVVAQSAGVRAAGGDDRRRAAGACEAARRCSLASRYGAPRAVGSTSCRPISDTGARTVAAASRGVDIGRGWWGVDFVIVQCAVARRYPVRRRTVTAVVGRRSIARAASAARDDSDGPSQNDQTATICRTHVVIFSPMRSDAYVGPRRGAVFLALVPLVACAAAAARQDKGGPCAKDQDCATGLACLTSTGTCSDDGFSCPPSGTCPAGLSCLTVSLAFPACVHIPRRADDSCDDQQLACGAGLGCFGLESRTCVVPDDYRGRACSFGWECPPTLACQFGPDGGACADPGDGLDDDCTETKCAAPSSCNQGYDPPRCRPPGSVGEPCFRGAELGLPGGDCAEALVCNWALSDRAGAGRCAEPGVSGTSCRRDEECTTGLTCLPSDGGSATCG